MLEASTLKKFLFILIMMSCCNYIGMVIDVRFASGYWQLRESLGIFGCVIEPIISGWILALDLLVVNS